MHVRLGRLNDNVANFEVFLAKCRLEAEPQSYSESVFIILKEHGMRISAVNQQLGVKY